VHDLLPQRVLGRISTSPHFVFPIALMTSVLPLLTRMPCSTDTKATANGIQFGLDQFTCCGHDRLSIKPHRIQLVKAAGI
jgi:hypothetical protein